MGSAFSLEIKDTTLMDAIVSMFHLFFVFIFQILATSFEQHQHLALQIRIFWPFAHLFLLLEYIVELLPVIFLGIRNNW